MKVHCKQKNFCTIVFLSFLMALSFFASAENHLWPCWRGPNHDGKSANRDLLKEWPEGGPELLWKLDVLGKGFSTVSISNDLIYTTGDVDEELLLYAIEMDGTVKWKVPAAKAWKKSYHGSRSTPTIDDGRIYVLSGNGDFVCLKADTGKPLWSKKMQDFGGNYDTWGYAESPLVLDDKVVVKPGGENCIVAFNKVNGDVVWKSTGFVAGPQYSSCVPIEFGGTKIITTGTHGGIVGVSAETGKLLWMNDICKGNTANCPDPAYSDGYVFWSNGYAKGGICLKLSGTEGDVTATEAWRTRDMDCFHGGYIIHEGYIYGNHSKSWSCLELKTGKIMWNQDAVGRGSVCFADGMLYLFGEDDGQVALTTCSPEGMEIKGMFQVHGSDKSWAHPVVVGGRLYLRYANNLYCYNVSAKK